MGKTVEFEAKFTYRPEYQFSAELEVKPPESRKPPRPPWHRRLKDRHLDAGKLALKEAIREAIVGVIKWLFFGRKRQPAQA